MAAPDVRTGLRFSSLGQKSTQAKGLLHTTCKRLILRCGVGASACWRDFRQGLLNQITGCKQTRTVTESLCP